jgi:hypothetical protein
MKPNQLKCYPQVSAVIGEALADYELQRVIDCDKCHVNIDRETVGAAFAWRGSPQTGDFWKLIDRGQNPYDHGHEKPEVKEWGYMGENWYKLEFLNKKGFPYKATTKSVTMPDWVPELSEITPTNSDKTNVHKSESGYKEHKSDTFKRLRKQLGSEAAYRIVWGDPESESKDGPNEKLKAAFDKASEMGFDKPINKYKVLCKGAEIDVYDVLLAYAVTNPADQHAIKKMLMPGKRGVKDANQDRKEAIQSLERAIELASASE